MKYPQNDEEWAFQASAIAEKLVMDVDWPWTQRQKHLWFIGVLAPICERKFLETATMAELQEAYTEAMKLD